MDWRAVFLVNVPIVVVAGLVAHRTVAESRDGSTRRLDVPGVLSGAGFLAALTAAVIGSERGGLSPLAVTMAVLSLALLVCFVVVERRASDRSSRWGCCVVPAFTVANATAGAMNFGTSGCSSW